MIKTKHFVARNKELSDKTYFSRSNLAKFKIAYDTDGVKTDSTLEKLQNAIVKPKFLEIFV